MRTNEIIGYQVTNVNHYGVFVDHADGSNVTTNVEPVPVSVGDAYRRLAAFLEAHPTESPTSWTVKPVYRETTPVEDAAHELGGRLLDLCARHNLDLGLTREQIDRQIAKELEALKTDAAPGIGFLTGGIPQIR